MRDKIICSGIYERQILKPTGRNIGVAGGEAGGPPSPN